MNQAEQELYVYSMGRGEFLLQHVADAITAQNASPAGKPIGLVFALVGLYLFLERGYTGYRVQQEHGRLANRKPVRPWPPMEIPEQRGDLTAADVLAVPEGDARDEAIIRWCRGLWASYATNRDAIIAYLHDPPPA